MPFKNRVPAEPEETKVLMNLRIPWKYRETLRAEAARREMSINKMLVDIVTREIPMDPPYKPKKEEPAPLPPPPAFMPPATTPEDLAEWLGQE